MRPKNIIPTYRLHQATGQARCVVNGKTHYLGPYESPESRREYARILTELAAGNGVVATPIPAPSGTTSTPATSVFVSELILAYRRHAAEYYVKNGRKTSEVAIVKMATDVVHELYQQSQVTEFGPLALTACQQKLIDQKLARSSVNKLVNRIRLMFKWGVAHQMVPESVHRALECVEGLRKGRSKATESRKIRPVPDQIVGKASPFMPRQVAAMVQLQSLTGCRPGEIVIIRGCDLNMSGKIWEYKPAAWKTEHHEDVAERVIYIGPKAQRVLKPWLRPNLSDYLFSPKEALAELNAERRESRKTPVYPSHQARYEREKARRGRRPDHDHYTVENYRQAIERACEKAKVPAFKPNQLRHSLATRLRRDFGLEATAAVLGHEELETSQIYAEKDAKLAKQVMGKIG